MPDSEGRGRRRDEALTGDRGIGDESGQMLVLFVFALAALMGFLALTIDVGQIFVDRRQAQNAADAAALAAVAYLPSDSSTAVAKANEYLGLNGMDPDDPTNTVTITTPYQGDPNKIEVQVTHQLGTLFAGVVGVNEFQITGRAVAERVVNNYALFQTGPNPAGDNDGEDGDDDPDCDGEMELEGDSMFIDGDTHADGEFEIEGDGVQVTGAVTYVCSWEDEGTGHVFGSGPTHLLAPVPPPVSFQYSDFGPCTFFVDGDLKISAETPQYFVNDDPNTLTLKPGLYCATGDIELDEDDDDGDGDPDDLPPGVITGNVTFVAHGEIEIEADEDEPGSGLNLTAYDSSGVLAYTDGCEDDDDDGGDGGDGDGDEMEGEIELEAASVTFSGMLIAACGEVEVEGDTIFSPATLIIGHEVEVEGDSVSITAANFTLGGPRLIE